MPKRKRKIAFDLISDHRGGPYISAVNIMNSELNEEFDFCPIEYNRNIGKGISFKRIQDLRRQMKQVNPDMIIIAGLQLSCFNVMLASILAGIKKRTIVIHGSSMEALYVGRMKRLALFFIEYISLALCTSFYGVSKYASTISAAKFFPKKNLGHIYNLPTVISQKNPYQKSNFGFKADDIVFATSGRIIRDKGFAILTDAIQSIDVQNIKFLIIGDGDYWPEMKRRLSEKEESGQVVFTGFVSNVIDILGAADAFVLPTLHETLSISLLEAGWLSLPLISCNVGGVPEVIIDNFNGILIPPNNYVKLKDAILCLANSPHERRRMGTNARNYITTSFSKKSILNKLREIFNA